MICYLCNKEFSDNALVLDSKQFHSIKCALDYANKRIGYLSNAIDSWKNAWYEQREIIGRLGLLKIKQIQKQNEKTN